MDASNHKQTAGTSTLLGSTLQEDPYKNFQFQQKFHVDTWHSATTIWTLPKNGGITRRNLLAGNAPTVCAAAALEYDDLGSTNLKSTTFSDEKSREVRNIWRVRQGSNL